MKKSVLYSAMISTIFMLSGCGSDSDDHRSNPPPKPTVPETKPPITEPETKPPVTDPETNPDGDKELTPEQKQQVLEVVKQTSQFSLKESLLSGVVDTLVYGTDEADAGAKCAAGSYARSQDTLTFKNCDGLFQVATGLNQHQGLRAVSGSVILKNDIYEYKNLVLLNTHTGESKTLTGKLMMTGDDFSSEILVDQLLFNATEKRDNKDVVAEYSLKNYKLNYDKKGASTLSLITTGYLSAKNTAVGDFNIQFKTTQALMLEVNPKDEDAMLGYPYAGVIEIEDLYNTLITTYQSNNDQKTVLYSVKRNNKEIDKGTKNWSDILSYSQ